MRASRISSPLSRYFLRSLSPSGWPKWEVSRSQGEWGGVVREDAEERVVSRRIDEIDGGVGEQVGDVASGFDGFVVVVDLVGEGVAFEVSRGNGRGSCHILVRWGGSPGYRPRCHLPKRPVE